MCVVGFLILDVLCVQDFNQGKTPGKFSLKIICGSVRSTENGIDLYKS